MTRSVCCWLRDAASRAVLACVVTPTSILAWSAVLVMIASPVTVIDGRRAAGASWAVAGPAPTAARAAARAQGLHPGNILDLLSPARGNEAAAGSFRE